MLCSSESNSWLTPGTWDAQSIFVGPYIAPHTNITEIDAGLDLLWRAGVSPDKVVMGEGRKYRNIGGDVYPFGESLADVAFWAGLFIWLHLVSAKANFSSIRSKLHAQGPFLQHA